ncbi:hypothetical protein AX774_g1032 [Zancudomyces culisetae]|uniref:Uncharacterized protein n=1 Tax=Zancudomyces culisetae TaxID=1213189 RepID=A0A1R1PWP9_ZANCU|nr:hypothetical protein AX774_g1032 [Zancudomyces culisetae]|eukprot:OMH85410.1 hypothetical protein AX774_g1032 [Zancudomyces culisetae]
MSVDLRTTHRAEQIGGHSLYDSKIHAFSQSKSFFPSTFEIQILESAEYTHYSLNMYHCLLTCLLPWKLQAFH